MTTAPRGRTLGFRIALPLLGVLLGMALGEVGLRGLHAYRARRHARLFRLESDPALGVRLAPSPGATDAWGHNNDAVPERADVVAIGDSQTWGYGVPRDAAWPQTLARRSGQRVYNLSLGKYGPLQYRHLLERALSLRPSVVVAGLYLGNDLRDAYLNVYCTDRHPELRRTGVPFCEERTLAPGIATSYDDFLADYRRREGGIALALADRSELFALLARRGLWPAAKLDVFATVREWALANPDVGAVLEDDRGTRTVFTSGLQAASLDLDEVGIDEGLRLSIGLLEEMSCLAGESGARFLVLVIPTKESAHATAFGRSRFPASPAFLRAVELETRVRRRVRDELARSGIPCVDPLGRLQAAVESGTPVSSETLDNHYNPAGQLAIATEVHAALEALGWIPRRGAARDGAP